MSAFVHLQQEPIDVVHHLYLTAEALRHLAETLPESMGGLGLMLQKIERDVHLCAVILDDTKPPETL